jgi:GTP diphosphokinase / guanosine-3',5'-bis(diphosphate) 3'-diphosphatase
MPEEIVRVNEANQKSDRLEKQVATPADFTSPEVLYEDLIQEIRKYHPSSDLSDIERAYKIARDAHEGQKRKSGEPYIIHPLCVAIILAELELDKETIIAGLLPAQCAYSEIPYCGYLPPFHPAVHTLYHVL